MQQILLVFQEHYQKNCYDVEINTNDSRHKSSIFPMIVYENREVDVNT
jgi:hypothetical protein